MTGLLIGKRLEFLHEMVPKAATIAYLGNSNNPNFAAQSADVDKAARALGLELHALNIGADTDFDAAFASLAQHAVGALFVGNDPFFFARREKIVALAARHSVPASYYTREFVAAGGLMSYAASFVDGYRQAGVYAGRILKGESAANLPVVQSVKFELVINLKTARELRLNVPDKLLVLAEEVID